MPVLSGQSRADERCAMKCPFCGAPDTKVIDSRLAAGGNGVRRRRECLSCRERFTTFETAELVMPKVIKKDGSREPFSDEKIRGGFMEALHKRPVSVEDIERALMQLKLRIRGTGEREIPSSVIGDFVMESLKELDRSHTSGSPRSTGASRISTTSTIPWRSSRGSRRSARRPRRPAGRKAPQANEFIKGIA